jgi:PAS domain S-box-containing protein
MDRQTYILEEQDRALQEWGFKAVVVGAGIFLLLAPLDFLCIPERARAFLAYRAAAAALLAGLAALVRRAQRPRTVRLLIWAATAVAASTIEAMILQFRGHQSPYLMGMVLVAVFTLGVIPAGTGLAVLLAGTILAVYLVPLLGRDTIGDPLSFSVSAFLFSCTLATAVLIRWIAWQRMARELALRHELTEQHARLETETAARAKDAETLREEVEQRRRAEVELRTFVAAIDEAAEGIYVVGLDGVITYVNKAVETRSGYPPERYLGKPVSSLMADPGYPGKVILPALERTGVWAGEIEGRHRDGSLVTLWLSASLVRGADGRPVAIVGITKDLSAQRRVEEEHIRNQKLESIGVLAGGLAHDFNNLLTIIIGNVDLARLFSGGNAEAAEALDHAAEAALRAGDLTRQLITFSKGGRPVKRVTDIGRLLRDTVAFAAAGSNVACECDIAPELPSVECDEGQMRQVIHNLVQNAREAMPEGGSLSARALAVTLGEGEVASLPAGRYVRVDVADHGAGIAREHLTRIFDPYFSTKEMGTAKGRGLGLAVSHSIIRNHGGAILVDSRLGEGTTVTLLLPAASAGAEPEEDEEELPEAAAGGGGLRGEGLADPVRTPAHQPVRGKVLVMDDEVLVLEMAGAALRQLGYEATLCRDGAEAIVRYEIALDAGRPFDMVILDLTVPGGMGGLEALERLREVDPKVCAVLSSGYTEDPAARDFARAGFAAFVGKPYALKTLEEVLALLT